MRFAATASPGFTPPHLAHVRLRSAAALPGADFLDVARAAAAVGDPSFSGEIEELACGKFPLLADPALALPAPAFVATESLGVLAFVVERGEEFEVGKSVVLLFPVAMVDVESVGDRSVLSLPDNVVGEPLSSLLGIIDPVVALGGDGACAGCVLAWGTSFAHSVKVSHEQGTECSLPPMPFPIVGANACSNPSRPALRSARELFAQ